MTFLVPFDGSALSSTALERATAIGDATDTPVVALTVVPDDRAYARERGWLLEDERFDPERIHERMRTRVTEIAPAARFRSSVVDSTEPTATPRTTVVREIKRVAAAENAEVVFVGTENAGSVVEPDSSVGGPVANDPQYDVYVVRKPE